MTLSDLLSLVEIFVTILFGYYITHWVTVRDTRTRSVKELYLNQLSDIKKRVDFFFSDLLDGKLKWRDVADWYGHQQNALTNFDDGLRLALPIRKRKLEDIVNDIHESITGSDYFNENFKKKKYELNNDEKAKVLALKGTVDKAFNEYVVQINNSRQYYFWETIRQNYNFDKAFFNDEGSAHPKWDATKIRIWKSLPYIFALIVIFFLMRNSYKIYIDRIAEEKQHQEMINVIADNAFKKIDSLTITLKGVIQELDNSRSMDSCQTEALNREIEFTRRQLIEFIEGEKKK